MKKESCFFPLQGFYAAENLMDVLSGSNDLDHFKEKKQKDALLASVAVGDSVLTTAGFYGVIVDMNDDTVIVEFGNNKNCRIPMQKAAIVQVEKPEDAIAEDESKTK